MNLDQVAERFEHPRKTSNGYSARCPIHDDRNNSLCLGEGEDGRILIFCQAGCATEEIVKTRGWSMRDLMPSANGNGTAKRSIVATYDYRDSDGVLQFQKVRFDDPHNKFRQRRPDGKGDWIWNLRGVRKILYRSDRLAKTKPEDIIFVLEGEKDVDTAERLGLLATTSPDGAAQPGQRPKWAKAYSKQLAGRRTVFIGDNDAPGRAHRDYSAETTIGIAASVKSLDLPGLENKGEDFSDWVGKGHTVGELMELVEAAPEFSAKGEPTLDDFLELTREEGRTDRANGLRFAKMFGDCLRYCPPMKSWLAWDGRRWQLDAENRAKQLAKTVSDDIWRLARQCGNPFALEWAVKSAQDSRINAMLNQAATEPSLVIMPDALDNHPWLLNCPNGIVDLKTGELLPHNRELMITKLCPTRFNLDAPSLIWDRFLEAIFDGRQDLIDFVQRHFGICLTGDTSEQIIRIDWGKGANGKSKLHGAVRKTLGKDYAMQGSPEMLMERKHPAHSTERMDLFGIRFVSCVETQDGQSINEAFVKQLTGGEAIRGRRCHENPWEFEATHKIVLCTNHKPRIKGSDHAIWRRLRLVPFVVTFWDPDQDEDGPPELRQDKRIEDKLLKEREGILAWMVRGCLRWQAEGLGMPEQVKVATSEYRSEQDIVGRFLRDCCTDADGCRIKFKSLYERLETYCDDTGINKPSRKFVTEYLQQVGYVREPKGGIIWYRGIAILTDEEMG